MSKPEVTVTLLVKLFQHLEGLDIDVASDLLGIPGLYFAKDGGEPFGLYTLWSVPRKNLFGSVKAREGCVKVKDYNVLRAYLVTQRKHELVAKLDAAKVIADIQRTELMELLKDSR